MQRTRLITAPALEPVTLDEVKDHLRVDIADDDALIAGYMLAARQHVETTILSGALITQTWELVLDDFRGDKIVLPRPPLQSVTSVKYTDENDSESTYSSANYLVDADAFPGFLQLRKMASWPTVSLREIGGVVVRFVAGYGDGPDSVPEPIRQALMLLVGDMYENRENSIAMPGLTTINQVPFAVRTLLDNYRRRVF